MIPPKSYEKSADLEPTLQRYARLFDLGAIGKQLGYPMFMKPYDGGGWVGVTKIDDEAALRAAYEESGTQVMHLQAGVIPYDRFVRCIGLGPQTRVVNYDPAAPLHDRYRMERDFISAEEQRKLQDMTLTINAFFGWDFNSCEALRKGGVWYPIDFANPCPDSQVTSLHYHFPWLVKANLRWSIFCAATKRRCGGTSTGSRTSGLPPRICRRTRSCAAMRSSPASVSTRTRSASSARSTWRISTRSRVNSSAAAKRAMQSARK